LGEHGGVVPFELQALASGQLPSDYVTVQSPFLAPCQELPEVLFDRRRIRYLRDTEDQQSRRLFLPHSEDGQRQPEAPMKGRNDVRDVYHHGRLPVRRQRLPPRPCACTTLKGTY